MPTLLFVVESTFTIRGRGAVLCPGPSKESWPPGLVVRPGMPIELRRLDGTTLATSIRSIEWAQTTSGPSLPIVLPREAREEDVPPGTEVWIVP